MMICIMEEFGIWGIDEMGLLNVGGLGFEWDMEIEVCVDVNFQIDE